MIETRLHKTRPALNIKGQAVHSFYQISLMSEILFIGHKMNINFFFMHKINVGAFYFTWKLRYNMHFEMTMCAQNCICRLMLFYCGSLSLTK